MKGVKHKDPLETERTKRRRQNKTSKPTLLSQECVYQVQYKKYTGALLKVKDVATKVNHQTYGLAPQPNLERTTPLDSRLLSTGPLPPPPT